MKNIIYLAACFAFAAFLPLSCDKKTNDFTAEFSFQGIESDMASVTVFGLRDSVRLDLEDPEKPFIPVTDGKFTVSGSTPQGAVLRVSLSKDRQFFKYAGRGYFPNKASSLWFVVTPGARLKGSADLSGKNFFDYYPDGDKENDIFARFARDYMPVQSRLGDIAVIMAVDSTLTEAERDGLASEAEALEVRSDRMRRDLVTKHPSSLAGLWMMEDMLIRSQIEPAELEPLLATFQTTCWDFTETVRKAFDKTQNGKKKKAQFSEEVLSGRHAAVHHSVEEISALYDIAYDLYSHLYEKCVSLYGEDDPKTMNVRKNLTVIKQRLQGDHSFPNE